MKTIILSCLFYCLVLSSVFSQLQPYPIDQYKARFDRRPAMFIDPEIRYNGSLSNNNKANNALSLGLPLQWSLSTNTDEQIINWSLNSSVAGQFGLTDSSPTNFKDRYSSFTSSLNLSREVRNFYAPSKFWGWTGRLIASTANASRDDGVHNYRLIPSLGLFHGHGRIEFAEDALLANWIMEDLANAEVINRYEAEDVELLARTITSIIGNRTFDFRRRRIYELRQLYQTLADNGIVTEESFDLFAIINDNWAFANRATLRHGRQLTYGVDAGTVYLDNDRFQSSFIIREFNANGGAYVRFEDAKIVNNNGSRLWTIDFSGGYNYTERDFSDISGIATDEIWNARLSASYQYDWLPISRMAFSLRGSFVWDRLFPSEEDDFPFFTKNQLSFNGFFSADYFVNYQWSISCSASVFAGYSISEERQDLLIRPRFLLSSRYFIF
jgi:hypothetical protein